MVTTFINKNWNIFIIVIIANKFNGDMNAGPLFKYASFYGHSLTTLTIVNPTLNNTKNTDVGTFQKYFRKS